MNTVTELHPGQAPGVELVDSAELALMREQLRLAAVLVIAIYDRQRRGWFRTPMRFVHPLAAALLKGRRLTGGDQQCACIEPSCRCTEMVPNDGGLQREDAHDEAKLKNAQTDEWM